MSKMKERMHTGELYFPGDPEISQVQVACLDRLYEFNQTRPTEYEKRRKSVKAATSNRRSTPTSAAATCISARTSTRTST